MQQLTKRQTEILELINNYVEKNGAPPTRAEIAQFMGFKSPNAAEDHLRALAKKGIIELLPSTSRGIRVLKSAPQGLPIVGNVAAGQPILATAHVDAYYKIDKNLFLPAANYLLRVKGDSMRNIGILDGDLLVVHATNNVKNGQIVVARIDNEVTVKRFKKDVTTNKISLMPENENYSPIIVDGNKKEFAIEGIGVGIIRTGFSQK